MANADTDITDEGLVGKDTADALEAAAKSADQELGGGDVDSIMASCTTFIEIVVVDENDEPVADENYRLVLTDGSVREGVLGSDGRIFVDSILPGKCRLSFVQMLGHGVPEQEVERQWGWDNSPGQVPDEVAGKDEDDSE